MGDSVVILCSLIGVYSIIIVEKRGLCRVFLGVNEISVAFSWGDWVSLV